MRRALLLLAVVLCGCPQIGELWTCDDPPCDECECAAIPAEWSRPVTLWRGEPGAAPPCPDGIAWEGVAPFAEPPGCPVCACGPAEVTCAPPATWEARSDACAGDAQYVTDFSPPPGWDGSCTAAGAVGAGSMCGGGPCVQSVEVGAPEVSLAPCAPVEITVPKDGTLSTAVRACERPRETCAGGWCGEAGDCVFLRGEHECPSPWDERSVFFETAPDAGGCTSCECGPPMGGSCGTAWSVFTDDSCMDLLVTNLTAGPCWDVPPGSALGSKTAEVVSTMPGSCAAIGGEPMAPQPSDPVTFRIDRDLRNQAAVAPEHVAYVELIRPICPSGEGGPGGSPLHAWRRDPSLGPTEGSARAT